MRPPESIEGPGHFLPPRQRLSSYLPVLLTGLALLGLGVYADHLNTEARKKELRTHVRDHLGVVRAQMETHITSNAMLVRGLVSAIAFEPELNQERFANHARYLFRDNAQLINIGAAPDFVIRYVYPLQGNEAALGLDYRKTPDQYEAVRQAQKTGQPVLAGPVDLVQGGKGLIARVPVYTHEGGGRRFWGIVSVVIDVDRFYKASGLPQLAQELDVAIRGKDALGEEGEVFFGDAAIFASEPEQMSVSLPYGSWQIAARPIGGWSAALGSRWSYRTGLLLLAGFILVNILLLSRALERRRESEARLLSTLGQAPVLIWMAETHNESVWFNRRWFQYTGRDLAQEAGSGWLDGVHPDDRQRCARHRRQQFDKREVVEMELRLRRADGTYGWLIDTGIPIFGRGGQFEGYIGYCWDITERKRIEELKREFISTVGHELRTPLTSIRGSLGLLEGGALGELPPAMESMFRIARNNTDRLLMLINDLLDVQKLESGQMSLQREPTELVAFLRKTIAENRGYTDQYHVEIRLETELESLSASVDRLRMAQVMANLLSNAAKFSPAKSQVIVGLERRAGAGRISVRDEGPGIPLSFQPLVFQRFSQLDATDTRQKGGTGLGLNIAKTIVELHGGRVGFETEMGKGTTFYVELPLASAEA